MDGSSLGSQNGLGASVFLPIFGKILDMVPITLNEFIFIVVIASICAGIGMAIGGQMAGGLGGLVFGLVVGAITALIGWFIWSFITYFIGTRVFKGPKTKATYGELLRCIGFSSSPDSGLFSDANKKYSKLGFNCSFVDAIAMDSTSNPRLNKEK